MTVTDIFRTTSGDYFGVVLNAWFRRRGWMLLLPIIATLSLGIVLHDERWMLMSLMLVFIVAPMAMSFIYTYYMLTPEARRAILPKYVEIDEGRSITLVYVRTSETEASVPTDERESVAEAVPITIEDSLPEPKVPEPETISWDKIGKISYTSRFRVYHLVGGHMQFILIPHASFPRASAVE
ncbi:MAG: hypothetical protein K2K92_02295 [Duncaniella sp.]|nr:hypothetical protein [Duncaniella sp.]